MTRETSSVLESVESAIARRKFGAKTKLLQPYQLAEYRAARNWLRRYRPKGNATNLEKVKGQLEAFAHLCNVAEWESARQIAFSPVEADRSEELHELLFVWGCYEAQRQLYQGLRSHLDAAVDLVCLSGLGSLHDVSGQYALAVDCHQKALTAAIELGSEAALSSALGGLGNAYLSMGEMERATASYQEQLAVAQAANDCRSIGIALGNLGNAHRIAEDYGSAYRYATQRIELARQVTDQRGEGDGLCNLGSLYYVQGQLEKAVGVLWQSVKIGDRIGHRLGVSRAYGNLGLVYVALEQKRRAVECFEKSLALAVELGDREGKRLVIVQLGALYQQLSDYERAIDYQRQAVAFVEDPVRVAALLLNLGTACREVGRLAEAAEFYRELVVAASILTEDGSEKRLMQMMGLYCLALVLQAQGNLREAFRTCRAALNLSHESVAPLIDKCLSLQRDLGMALCAYPE